MKVVLDKHYEVFNGEEVRIYRDLVLPYKTREEIRFTLSLPREIPPKGLPCVIIIDGLKTGRESLKLIPNHGKCALVGYEYPKRLRHLKKIDFLWHMMRVRRAMLDIPGQILTIANHLKEEKWLAANPISLMGCSFGGGFIPVTYVNAQRYHTCLGPGVIAYGGAGVKCVIRANFPGPKWVKKLAAICGEKLFRPIDPMNYAAKMKGDFLIVNGIYDGQVPFACAQHLQRLIPEPKTVINLETKHMDPTNAKLILQLIELSQKWLNERFRG